MSPSAVVYRAPRWLRGGHAQTIYPALFLRGRRPRYRRERWDTPDGDFIDLDFVDAESGRAPRVVLFHGLEGSSSSHYARSLMRVLAHARWGGVVVHFRGCSGEPNRLPRAYHSGDAAEIGWILARMAQAGGPLYAAGVSLGGNALLKWLGESGAEARACLRAAAAVSAPLDLMAAGAALERGLNLIYTRMFLATLRAKSLAKLERFPGLFERERVLAARKREARAGGRARADAGAQCEERSFPAGAPFAAAAGCVAAGNAGATRGGRPRGFSERGVSGESGLDAAAPASVFCGVSAGLGLKCRTLS